MLCYAMLCYAMLCYAHAMLCHAMPCHAITLPHSSIARTIRHAGWRMEDGGWNALPPGGWEAVHTWTTRHWWMGEVCLCPICGPTQLDRWTDEVLLPQTHHLHPSTISPRERSPCSLRPPSSSACFAREGAVERGGGGEEEPCTERRGVGGHSAVARRGGGENHGDGMSPAGIIGTWTCHEMSRQAASHISPPRQRYPRQGWIEAFPPWRVRATSDLFPW